MHGEGTKRNLNIVKSARNQAECLFKDIKIKCSCNNENIKTQGNHLIQKHKYLKGIARKNIVMCFSIEKDQYYRLGRQLLQCNVKNTHKYNVFCGQHDKDLFSKIENGNIFNPDNKQQCFQFALRAFTFNFSEQLVKNNLTLTSRSSELRASIELDYDKSILKKFQHYYKNGIWDAVETYTIILDKKIKFISCSSFYPFLKMNKFPNGNVMDKLFFNIFPHEEKSFINISYFKGAKQCEKLCKQLDKYVKKNRFKEIEYYLSKMIVSHDKHIVLSPELWESWSEEQQNDFYKYAHLFKDFKLINLPKACYILGFKKPIFDLFRGF